MRTCFKGTIWIIWLLSGLCLKGAGEPGGNPPNIVFILADDWGWGDLGHHGHPWLQTPHLDRLAREGTSYGQFNVLNPVCSPSRAAFMTGLHPARFGIHQHFHFPAFNRERGMPDWLDPTAVQLPRLFQQAGYRTGHYGKWHLTNRGTSDAPAPTAYGIDEWAVFNGAWEEAPLEATGRNAAAFIKRHRDRPFYLQVSLHQTHTPHVPSASAWARHEALDERARVYAAVVSDGDDDVGLILAALEDCGLTDRTLVIFTSDNGPERPGAPQTRQFDAYGQTGYGLYYSVGSTGGFRGLKRSLFEGGVRVPFIVRWPGQVPAGRRDDTTWMTAVDLLPSFCAVAGIPLPDHYHGDGESFWAAWQGDVQSRTQPAFWQWLGTDAEPDWWPRLAVREGAWKLLTDQHGGRLELYDLEGDAGERHNRASELPELTVKLRALLFAWRDSLPNEPDPRSFSRLEKPQNPVKGLRTDDK